jgi:formylglycine-generating enzyme required for sulfatase activity
MARPAGSVALLGFLLTATGVPAGAAAKCPPDSAQVGSSCVDRFEASVWLVPEPTGANKGLVKKLLKGKTTAAALTAAGATRLGCDTPAFAHQLFPKSFPTNGNWVPLAGSNPLTPGVYATSLAGELPTACITWFQAAQACALSGKRLATNEEWQRAAAGTPDPGDADTQGTAKCNTKGAGPAPTGNLAECVSSWGVYDLIGNVWEWVADWADNNEGGCSVDFLGDISCFGGSGDPPIPGALRRGGAWPDAGFAGSFSVSSVHEPTFSDPAIGFRCAR